MIKKKYIKYKYRECICCGKKYKYWIDTGPFRYYCLKCNDYEKNYNVRKIIYEFYSYYFNNHFLKFLFPRNANDWEGEDFENYMNYLKFNFQYFP